MKTLKPSAKKLKKKERWKGHIFATIAIGLAVFIGFILVSNLLEIGGRLAKISIILEIAFYILSTFLFYFFVVRPLAVILFAPAFPLGKVYDEKTPEYNKTLKKIAKNLIKNDILTSEQEATLLEILDSEGDLKDALAQILSGSVKKDVNEIIVQSARNVMFMTALSQNSSIDMVTVLINSMSMIKKIVIRCGFRPSYVKLAKLYINVFTTALIADGIERVGIETVFSGLKGTKGLLIGSMSEGVTNAFLMLRLGMVARNYIFNEGKSIVKEEIRRSAVLEAAKILPSFVTEVITIIPKTLLKFFTRKNDSDVDSEVNNEK